MEKGNICIGCPMGCPQCVQLEGREILSITGRAHRGEVRHAGNGLQPHQSCPIHPSWWRQQVGKGFHINQDKDSIPKERFSNNVKGIRA